MKYLVYFLDNGYRDNNYKEYYEHDNLKELNEFNTELYINKKQYKYKKYFKPEKEGEYEIIIKFNIDLLDCSYMFVGCKNIIYINFESFNTKNIINMSHMFENCYNLRSLPDISKWDTKNVTDMSGMFYNCSSLKSLPDISKWDVKNVKKMKAMFFYCNRQTYQSY